MQATFLYTYLAMQQFRNNTMESYIGYLSWSYNCNSLSKYKFRLHGIIDCMYLVMVIIHFLFMYFTHSLKKNFEWKSTSLHLAYLPVSLKIWRATFLPSFHFSKINTEYITLLYAYYKVISISSKRKFFKF